MSFALAVPMARATLAGAVAAVHRMAGEAAQLRRLGPAVMATDPAAPFLDLGPAGVVVGRLFTGARAVTSPSGGAAIAASGGDALIRSHWGAYVAALPRAGGVRLLRAPLGDVAVYLARYEGLVLAVSDPAMLLRLPGYRPRLSAGRLQLALIDPRTTSRHTGLEGLEELLPGEAVDLPEGTPGRRWRPERLVAPDGDPARALVAALDTVIEALTASGERFGMLLSGGLDSSIVLGSLVRAVGRDRLVALHHHMPAVAPELDRLPQSARDRPGLATVAGVSDELAYARLAAEAVGVELVVVPRTLAGVDFAALDTAPLSAAPSALVYRPDADAVEARFVTEHALAALFTGRGGDQALYASTSPLSAADFVRDGHRRGWRTAVAEAAARSGLPLPSVAWLSFVAGLGRARARRARLPAEDSFLAAEARRALGRVAEPWDDLLAALPPGKAQQLASLVDRSGYREAPVVRSASPLACQPLVEVCLAIPTYRLAEHGVSRGLARRAFADRLPPGIAARMSKAGGTGFVHRLADSRRAELRERLLGGVLAGTALLDRARLEARLADGVPWRELEPVRLLDLLAVESWARQWVARGAALP